MLIAITHKPSPLLSKGELTFLPPQEIDLEKARFQHEQYRRMLAESGARVITLDENLSLPDSAFVEDTAVVLDETAVITPMGVDSRRAETELVEKELTRFRPIRRIKPPAKLEGGDVLRIGKDLYAGLSTRTNAPGIKALEEIAAPLGYKVFVVNVYNSLHLKTACTAIDDETVLINPEWVDAGAFRKLKRIEVAPDEPFAANILRLADLIGIHSGFTRTAGILEKHGYETRLTDISEFLKAEAGLTCLSLIFNSRSK